MTVNHLDWGSAIHKILELLNTRDAFWITHLNNKPLIIIRDWIGRLHLCVPGQRDVDAAETFQAIAREINAELGLLSAGHDKADAEDFFSALIMFEDDLFNPHDIWDSEDKIFLQRKPFAICLLDRQDKELDWLRPRVSSNFQQAPRAVFFGVKGGVGRSTALVGLCIGLAQMGKRVLVIDADFESPGLSSSLISPDTRPDYGLVDWFAADALSRKDADILFELGGIVESSPLNKLVSGRIFVTPAFGRKSDSYVSKLGRLYTPTDSGESYAQRLDLAIERLEAEHKPDVILLDSRAGIDDTAAVAITRLGARAFLFAINTSQTWDAYELLFKHLQRHPSLHTAEDFRENFRLVSALTPDPALAPTYFDSFRERAYDLFQEIYDEIAPGEDGLDAFNFDFDDADAPHNPWRIRWDDSLRAFDPLRFEEHMSSELQSKVFGDFVSHAIGWLGVNP